MNHTTERVLETLLSQHDQVFRDYFVASEEASPTSAEYKDSNEAFDRVVADMIRACEPAELTDIIIDAPSGVDVNSTIRACEHFETDAPGLSFLRMVAMQVITAQIFINYTGSL